MHGMLTDEAFFRKYGGVCWPFMLGLIYSFVVDIQNTFMEEGEFFSKMWSIFLSATKVSQSWGES